MLEIRVLIQTKNLLRSTNLLLSSERNQQRFKNHLNLNQCVRSYVASPNARFSFPFPSLVKLDLIYRFPSTIFTLHLP